MLKTGPQAMRGCAGSSATWMTLSKRYCISPEEPVICRWYSQYYRAVTERRKIEYAELNATFQCCPPKMSATTAATAHHPRNGGDTSQAVSSTGWTSEKKNTAGARHAGLPCWIYSGGASQTASSAFVVFVDAETSFYSCWVSTRL